MRDNVKDSPLGTLSDSVRFCVRGTFMDGVRTYLGTESGAGLLSMIILGSVSETLSFTL